VLPDRRRSLQFALTSATARAMPSTGTPGEAFIINALTLQREVEARDGAALKTQWVKVLIAA